VRGLVALFAGYDILFLPVGNISDEEVERLMDAFADLPDHMAPGDEDITLLLLDEDGSVVAHRYARRERWRWKPSEEGTSGRL
jgi:hypothetical protein